MARKTNKALTKWVAFVKKVQKEEKIGYSEAMKRAKVRKDHGEKWMGGGGGDMDGDDASSADPLASLASPSLGDNGGEDESKGDGEPVMEGGRRRRRSSRSSRRSKRRSSSRRKGKRTRRR